MAHEHADDLACTEEVEMMTDYLEGALPPDQARRVELHLEGCPACTEYLEQMRTLAGGALSGLDDASIPADMRNELIAAFRRLRGDA